MNERVTEQLVRNKLREFGYYDDETIRVEEQKSSNPTIQKCLRRASKSGGKGFGRPEFIIKNDDNNNFVIVVECKADPRKHQSDSLDKYKEFSVDGVLLYAANLSTEFSVIAIAVSGQNEQELKISTFLHPKGAHQAKPLEDKHGNSIERIMRFDNYVEIATYDKDVEKVQYLDLLDFSQELHEYIRDYAKLSEAEKPLLVSGVLIALSNGAFRTGYRESKPRSLPQLLFNTIKEEIEDADIPRAKKKDIIQPYSFITAHPSLAKVNENIGESPLARIVQDIDRHVYPFISVYHNFDVIGQFYAEFLRYAGGDASLGIVLTPKHVTEIFVGIANLNPRSVVIDSCAGTAGFLIASMIDMWRKATTEDEIEHIKNHGLIGIESQPKMFSLAASNMILRGDGKTNLFQGSCFDSSIIRNVKALNPTVGMINPPYSQKGESLHELNFIDQLLDFLAEGSTGIAIVPMSCAIQPHPLREALLKKHTLDAVMSMPDDLFYPVGVIPCIMVWRAKVPHNSNPHHRTWFGYWKDDGFIKVKKKGRVDFYENWGEIKNRWLTAYFARSEIAGFSVLKKVTAEDEWCAEAYMETDYSDISESDFIKEMKKYLMYVTVNEDIDAESI